jgi:hypothetical protein
LVRIEKAPGAKPGALLCLALALLYLTRWMVNSVRSVRVAPGTGIGT